MWKPAMSITSAWSPPTALWRRRHDDRYRSRSRRRIRRHSARSSAGACRRVSCPSARWPTPTSALIRSRDTALDSAACRLASHSRQITLVSRNAGVDTDQRLAVPERGLPFCRQRQRIAFAAGGYRETVYFVGDDNPHRTRRQPGRDVGADDRKPAAGENLLPQRVAAIPRQWRLHLAGKARRVADHRRQAVLGPGLGHFDGRHDHQDRRRVLVDVEADDVAQAFGVADLAALGDHNAVHGRIGKRIHHAAEIFGARGVPMSGLGTCFRRQITLTVCPLADRQRRWWCKRGIAPPLRHGAMPASRSDGRRGGGGGERGIDFFPQQRPGLCRRQRRRYAVRPCRYQQQPRPCRLTTASQAASMSAARTSSPLASLRTSTSAASALIFVSR